MNQSGISILLKSMGINLDEIKGFADNGISLLQKFDERLTRVENLLLEIKNDNDKRNGVGSEPSGEPVALCGLRAVNGD